VHLQLWNGTGISTEVGFSSLYCEKRLTSISTNEPRDLHNNQQYAREHLAELSIEFLFEYVHSKILPQLVADLVGQSKEELGEERYIIKLKNILKPYQLSKVSMQTIYRWMKSLGF
jgi:hypothetical protein